ncbi:MAG TPA: PocR ligand-binding domain-containing protein [Acidimicrobiia bacterium]|jgi:excisionase family DNA binding protein|nr:PocR ligand-binding domain-containing protein [Acidimicrobiia bacterium]
MTTLLTTKDVQAMIHVDKSTIYRMAEDGRLPAIKVGRQWRFPADAVAAALGSVLTEEPGAHRVTTTDAGLASLLVPEAAQAVADLAADLFGVMAVVTDISGNPLTDIANPCGYFAAIHDEPNAVAGCIAGWRQLADEVDLKPRFMASHLGFLCARTFIRVGPELVGMLIVGGVTPRAWPPNDGELAHIASELNLPVGVLAEHVEETYYLDQAHQQWVLRLLPRFSDLISQLATARSQLLSKLDAIAVLAGAATSTQRSTT